MGRIWNNLLDSISCNKECYDYSRNENENILGNFYLQYFRSLNCILQNNENIVYLLEKNFDRIKTEDNNLSAFLGWYQTQAVYYLDTIIERIDYSKVDNKFNSYIKLYSKYLENAYDTEVLYEFLYLIPKKMCKDFERFSFFVNVSKDETYQRTFSKCYDRIQEILNVLDCKYSISMEYLSINEVEPDESQALVL